MRISVIIPAFNAERWLPETLRSVTSQEVPGLEVIVVDDGSTDGTAACVKSGWPQVKLVSTANKGVSHARNLGTSLATGELVQHLDADDVLTPGKVARQMELLAAHPEVDVVYCDWQRLVQRDDGSFTPGEKVKRTLESVARDPELAFFSDMWCPTGAYLYRREFLAKVGEWKAWLPVVQDARFAWDCARAGARWLHDPHIGVLYRQHRQGSISTRSRLAFLKDCWANMLDMERVWNTEGPLNQSRLTAVKASCENLVRSFFGVDDALFNEAYAHLLRLDPGFKSSHPGLRRLSSLVGYRNAEQIALWGRRAKQWLAAKPS